MLATGSNDNTVMLWDIRYPNKSLHTITKHNAAVKAIAWSPFSHNHLITGGGNGCGNIYKWNINNMDLI